jgi:hypothetical protein
MGNQPQYDWPDVFYRCVNLVDLKVCKPTYKDLSDELRIPRTTLVSGLKEFGIDSAKDLRRIVQIHKGSNQAKAREAVVTFTDKLDAEDVDWREFVDLAKTNQEFRERTDPWQKFATIHIDTELPIALMHTSDWHLGARYTDHEQWAEDIEFVLATPRLYMVDLGDDRENMRNFKALSSILEQVLTPRQQALMMRSVVEELTHNQKLLAKVAGNHDAEFDERIFGEALQSYLHKKMTAPKFSNRGLLKLYVGEILYTVLLFHKSRFKSFLRRTHGAMREHQLSVPADIVAGGHDHEPGMEHLYHYTLAQEAGLGFGGSTFFIKTGTYSASKYGWKYYHNGGFTQNYTMVLFPGEKRIVPFTNPRDAVAFMESFE